MRTYTAAVTREDGTVVTVSVDVPEDDDAPF